MNNRCGHLSTAHSIEERPSVVMKEKNLAVADTVLFSCGESKSCLAIFVEFKYCFLWVIKIPNHTSDSMEEALD